VRQLEEGGDRGFEVRHTEPPHQAAAPVIVGGAEGGESRGRVTFMGPFLFTESLSALGGRG